MEPRESQADRHRTSEDPVLPTPLSGGEAGSFLSGSFQRVLIACSGGADSVALLRIAAAWAKTGGSDTPELIVGHVHHGMRGQEADRDAVFVEELATSLGVRCLVQRVDPSSAPKSEGAAREIRYAAFREWADAENLDAILLAHHREDQQEGVLLRICRGTGWSGLAGMERERSLGGTREDVLIIRPLLECTRGELRAYLESISQPFRHDGLNDDLSVPRNRVRHEVLPLLEEGVHRGTREALERLAGHARQLEDDLRELASRAISEADLEVHSDCASLRASVLRSWPRSVRRAALRRLEVIVCGEGLTRLNEKRFSVLDDVVTAGSDGARIDVGGGLSVRLRDGWIELSFDRAEGALRERETPAAEVEIQIDGGRIEWGAWTIEARRAEKPEVCDDPSVEWIDEDALDGPLRVRGRVPGDRFHPLGASGSKKLKEFLRERGVEFDLRDDLPIVLSGDRIVWVVEERLAHPFRVRDETRRFVRLEAGRLSSS